MRRRRLAVVLLVVLAGCGAGVGGGDRTVTVNPALEETPSSTATPSPTATPTAGQTGEPAQRAARHAAVARTRSAAFERVRVVYTPDGELVARRTVRSRVDGDRSYVRARTQVPRPDYGVSVGRNVTVWTNGSVVVERFGPEATPLVRDRPPRRYERQTASARLTVYTLFAYWPVTYAGSSVTTQGTVDVFTARTPETDRPNAPTVRNLTATVVRLESGVVRSATVRYETDLAGRNVTVVRRLQLRALDGVTVQRPSWADDAEN
ncbi:hypothetical protein [Halobaculum sp. MBLA0143]|uniref:hypothetical protein n=1 Tax=Halobaculum sp. MBLA0143 TaxID=3079933 RepID=UPI0035258A2B